MEDSSTIHTIPPFSQGLHLGLKVSLIAASIYAILGVLYETVEQIWLMPSSGYSSLPILHYAGFLPLGFLLILGPVAVIGSLTGGILAELWQHLGRHINGPIFGLIGLVFCFFISASLHLIFDIQLDFTIPAVVSGESIWIGDTFGLLTSYPFLIGVPSIIYSLIGGGASYYFWRKHRNDGPILENPLYTPR